jgi:hypothetical protein
MREMGAGRKRNRIDRSLECNDSNGTSWLGFCVIYIPRRVRHKRLEESERGGCVCVCVCVRLGGGGWSDARGCEGLAVAGAGAGDTGILRDAARGKARVRFETRCTCDGSPIWINAARC